MNAGFKAVLVLIGFLTWMGMSLFLLLDSVINNNDLNGLIGFLIAFIPIFIIVYKIAQAESKKH